MIFQPDRRHILGLITRHLATDQSLLDVGCGSGDVAFHLERLGYRSIHTADIADFRCKASQRFILYDGVKLPFGDNAVDMVSFNFVFHHIPDARKKILAEAVWVSRRYPFILEDTPVHALDR